MAVPYGVNFDRFAEMTFGLDAITAGGAIEKNGVALVTGWLSNALFSLCQDSISTSWTVCGSDPGTFWTAVVTDPDTAWSEC